MAKTISLFEIWQRRLDIYRQLMAATPAPRPSRPGSTPAARFQAELRALREPWRTRRPPGLPPPSQAREVLAPQSLERRRLPEDAA
jgi:hypothetical protein